MFLVPRNHKDPTQGHLNANVVLTGPAYFSPYTQRKNLDAQMFLFHRSSLFRLSEVCLRYFSMSSQSREQLDNCVQTICGIAQIIWSWKNLMRNIEIIWAQFGTLMLSETLEETCENTEDFSQDNFSI